MFGTATYDFYVDDPRRGLSGGMAPALFCIYIAGDVDPTLHMHQHAMIVITSHHHSIYIHTCIQIRSDQMMGFTWTWTVYITRSLPWQK